MTDAVPARERTEPAEAVLVQRDELRRALGRLEGALSLPTGGGDWLERVRRELGALRRQFEVHLSVTEGADGLFADVLGAAPRLAHEIDLLRAEHDEIEREMGDAMARLEGSVRSDEVRTSLNALLGRLVRHRQRGADLLFEAYDTDLGGLD